MDYSNKKDYETLLQRISLLEMELDEIRQSRAYKLGHILGEAIIDPLNQVPFLPIRIARLLKERFNKKDIDIIGKKIKNRKRYTRSGREKHEFTLFDSLKVNVNKKNSTLKIACILNPKMYLCLDAEAHLTPLIPSEWKETLKNTKPDFVLIQSLLDYSNEWHETISFEKSNSSELIQLLKFCNRKHIPTVFWDTEDHSLFTHFLKFSQLFDQVCATDPKSVDEYRKNLKKEILHLKPAIQPIYHNPVIFGNSRLREFTILYDGWVDILESPFSYSFLKPLINEGLHIVESRFWIMANKLDDSPDFRENIMGCITYQRLLNAYRYYRLLIMPKKTILSNITRSWQTIEATACGCNVIACEDKDNYDFNELKINVKNDTDLVKVALELANNEIECSRINQLNRREIYNKHTYSHRLNAICNSLFIKHSWNEYPLISMILPTKRPALIKLCIEKYKKQKYPNKELIIVVNRDSMEKEEIKNIKENNPDIKVLCIHQEKNIGSCLNLGINYAKGEYWFKIDDDDFYGKYYISDMMNLAKNIEFDLMGKPPAFIYIEKEDQIYLRKNAMQQQYTVSSEEKNHLCGATLGGKRDKFKGFSETYRACVDTRFIDANSVMERTIYFNDIWNFIAFRSSDKSHHTWRQHDNSLIKNSSQYCRGLCLNKIMI